MTNPLRIPALRPCLLAVAVALFGCVDAPTASLASSIEEGAQPAGAAEDDPSFKACCTTFTCLSTGETDEWCTGQGGRTWGETRLACSAACDVACRYVTFCEQTPPLER